MKVNTNESSIRRALSMIGMCKKAGKIVSGVPLVCDAMREGRLCLAVYAAKASQNSVKRVCDKARSFECEALGIDVAPEELGHMVGKSTAVSAVGITDMGFAKAIKKIIDGE